jgi:hypothetical protein
MNQVSDNTFPQNLIYAKTCTLNLIRKEERFLTLTLSLMGKEEATKNLFFVYTILRGYN